MLRRMLKWFMTERCFSRSVRRQFAAVRVRGERPNILKLSLSAAPESLHDGMLVLWVEHVMRPQDLEAQIRAAVGDQVPIRSVRFQDELESSGPAVLYRTSAGSELSIMDGIGRDRTFEITCRSQSIEGARELAEDLLSHLSSAGRLAEIVEQFDDTANPSAIRGEYYSHVVVVRLA